MFARALILENVPLFLVFVWSLLVLKSNCVELFLVVFEIAKPCNNAGLWGLVEVGGSGL